MTGRARSLHDDRLAVLITAARDGVTPGSASQLTRAALTEAAVTTTASAATAIVVLRRVVPLCFVCWGSRERSQEYGRIGLRRTGSRWCRPTTSMTSPAAAPPASSATAIAAGTSRSSTRAASAAS